MRLPRSALPRACGGGQLPLGSGLKREGRRTQADPADHHLSPAAPPPSFPPLFLPSLPIPAMPISPDSLASLRAKFKGPIVTPDDVRPPSHRQLCVRPITG